MLPATANIGGLTEKEFEELEIGQRIWVHNKFDKSPWYEAEVTGVFPNSIAPSVNFRITDPDPQIPAGLRETEMRYWFSDAPYIAHREE